VNVGEAVERGAFVAREQREAIEPPPHAAHSEGLGHLRAQAIGADALAWSTLEMQEVIWGLWNRVPKILYTRTLPEAARAIAKALKLEQREVRVAFHEREHSIESSDRGWLVKALDDQPVTKPFDTRQQAERYLALTVGKFERTVPALMLAGRGPSKSSSLRA